jgi:glycerol-3-phosphate dehydrogenase (NAD(P)+)
MHGTKGLDVETFQRPSEVLAGCLGHNHPIGVLSGPTHAEEVGRGIPTAAVIACHDPEVADLVQSVLSSESFRLYTNSDLVGVELCAALKNVFAIAAGVSDGLGYGDNAKAALITRCLAELNRLVLAAGGQAGTVAGLAGIGDLVATCTSRHSRNRRAGELIGRGATLDQVLRETHQAIEGVRAVRGALALARQYGVEMPITIQVNAVLYEGQSPRAAIRELMSRVVTRE